jgi:hypothetical protein
MRFVVAIVLATLAVSAAAGGGVSKARLDAYVAEAQATLELAKARNLATQVHIALTRNPSEMQVTWSTFAVGPSQVRYGHADRFPNLPHIADGFITKFVDNGTLHHTQYIHRVTLEGLQGGERYAYQVRET